MVADAYSDCELLLTGPRGENVIQKQVGVKQGCPLSEVLFNLYSESLLESVTSIGGYRFSNGEEVQAAAFADDICSLASSEQQLSEQLSAIEAAAKIIGLTINPRKTRTLVIDFRGGNTGTVLQHRFYCGNAQLAALGSKSFFRYLGRPFGSEDRPDPGHYMRKTRRLLLAVRDSHLAPWQKSTRSIRSCYHGCNTKCRWQTAQRTITRIWTRNYGEL